jgi:hypothetical protein
MEARMLKKVTQGNWETSQNTIVTQGGTYIGTASTEENAKFMASSPKLLQLLKKYHPDHTQLEKEVNEILRSL